jgi:hypothetical protein
MSLAACSNSEEYAQLSEPVELQVTAGIGNGAKTRTETTSYIKWATGAKMSVTAVSGTTTSYSGVEYEVDAITSDYFAKFKTSSTFTFEPTETAVKFVAFTYNESTAPAVTTEDNNSVIKLTASDGSLKDLMTNTQTASPSSPIVNFAFTHLLSKLTIKIDKGDLTNDPSSATVEGFYGDATASVVETPTITAGTKSTSTATVAVTTDGSIFYLVPGKQELKVKVTHDSNTYTANIGDNLDAGKAYVCTITLTKSGLGIGGTITEGTEASSDNSCVIVDWDSNTDALSADASMANQ